MLSIKHKCIFVHIPKTAGQSIELYFLRLLGLNWNSRGSLLLRYNENPKKGPESLAHLTCSEYTELGYIDRRRAKEYFKFSFVRNPWDRLVSEYKYRYQNKVLFKDFVKQIKITSNRPCSDTLRHLLPQYVFLFDEEGKPLVDFIGRFENLQEDFNKVFKKLNIPGGNLGKRNVFYRRKHYSYYYDKETKNIVSEIYKKDIEIFGYKFEGPS